MEQDVCKALTGHYKKLVAETEVQLEGIKKAIAQHLSQASPDNRTSYETFQDKLKSTENTLNDDLRTNIPMCSSGETRVSSCIKKGMPRPEVIPGMYK